jgi:hypothetical protein
MPVCGSGAVVCSLFLLIRRHSVPAVRQKLHLSSCADFRSRLWVPGADNQDSIAERAKKLLADPSDRIVLDMFVV